MSLRLTGRVIDCLHVRRRVKDKQITPEVKRFIFVYAFPQLDEGTPPEPEGSFVDYQTSMVKYSKAIAVTAQEMVSL